MAWRVAGVHSLAGQASAKELDMGKSKGIDKWLDSSDSEEDSLEVLARKEQVAPPSISALARRRARCVHGPRRDSF